MRIDARPFPCHSAAVHAVVEDRELVRRMRAGDEAAFQSFADHYIAALLRFAVSRLADRELAREVVSATVCKAIEKLDSYRGEAPLFTWLCAVCRNEIAAHYRRQQGRPTTDIELADESGLEQSATPEDLLLETESSALVHRALDHLPPRYGAALQWKYIDGLPVDQIARRLELGLKAAESVLTRARQAFRGTYEQLAGKRQ